MDSLISPLRQLLLDAARHVFLLLRFSWGVVPGAWLMLSAHILPLEYQYICQGFRCLLSSVPSFFGHRGKATLLRDCQANVKRACGLMWVGVIVKLASSVAEQALASTDASEMHSS